VLGASGTASPCLCGLSEEVPLGDSSTRSTTTFSALGAARLGMRAVWMGPLALPRSASPDGSKAYRARTLPTVG
jgi:hypothetical protein